MIACALLLAGCIARPEPSRIVVHNVTVFDGTGAPLQPRMVIAISGDRINEVVPVAEFTPRGGDSIVDAGSLYAIPGLWDLHVHLSKTTAAALPVLLANGVTAVRDMGGVLEDLRAMHTAVRAGRLRGPRIFMAGPMLESPATLERMARKRTAEPYGKTRIPIPDTMRARVVVDSLAKLGVDFVKIREYAGEDIYRAVVAAAAARGLAVAGHAPFSMDPVEAARLGVRSFEHASYPYPLPEEEVKRAAVLAAFKTGGVAIVPTLVAWETNVMHPDSLRLLIADTGGLRDPRRRLLAPALVQEWQYHVDELRPRAPNYYEGYWGFIDRMSRDLNVMHAAGVPLLPGSDLASVGLFPGYALHDELERMVEWIGLSPAEVLIAATYRSAELLGAADSLGTIEPNKLADIVLLERNPLSDIHNTRTIRAVISGGKIISKPDLCRLLRGLDPTTAGNIVLSKTMMSRPAAPIMNGCE